MENVGFIAQFTFIKTRRLPFTSSILWTIKDIASFGFYVIIKTTTQNLITGVANGQVELYLPCQSVPLPYIHEINLS